MIKATICLNMIVKNEAPVIRRCLDTVMPFIDHWVIIDTGSQDGTQDIIREHLKDIPGQLIERPWVDFAHNRSEALAAARDKADYVLVIDADETLESDPGFAMPPLGLDSYNLEVSYGGCVYMRKAIVHNRLPWRYEGVLHEYICCDAPHSEGFVAGLRTIPHPDGARARDPNTYRHDALILERALISDPGNARNVFYLAQSYRDAGDHEMAVRNYKRRVELGGWAEEVWYSLYQLAALYERMQKPWPEVMEAYLAAFEFQADRAGPLYRIGMHYQAKGEYRTAHMFFAKAMQLKMPGPDRLFVETMVYQYLLPIEFAVACFYVGDHKTAIATNDALLRNPQLPVALVDQVTKNRRFSLDVLFPAGQPAAAPSRVQVYAPAPSASSRADDLIESLVRQLEVEAAFHLIGPVEGPLRLPDDPRFSHDPAGLDFAAAVRAHAAGLAEDALVVMLPVDHKLATSDALARWVAPLRDPTSGVAHGQYRHADGSLGKATPALDTAGQERLAADPAQRALAFRRGLLDHEAAAEPDLVRGLLAAAGNGAVRFIDRPLTTRLAAPPKPAPVLRGLAPSLPKISCLMVTYDRLGLAKRSMDCFAAQTYPNRELVVVTNGSRAYTDALQAHAELLEIETRFVHLAEPGLTLGRLRNLSIDNAGGEILCQWDDDDCNHPERLMRQAEHMFREGARACLMTDHLQFLQDDGVVVWVDWTLGGRQRVDQLLPGTVMMHRDDRFRYPETGEYASRGEDTMFLNDLYATVPVASLVGHGYLYLYTYHGRNTFSKEHHHHLSTYSRTAQDMRVESERICEALSHYPIEKPVMVGGRDGPSFVL